MRIAYGVMGYGRGHATRAAAVISELRKRHEVLIFAGADAHDALAGHHPLVRIPTLGYSYRRNGTRSNWLTFLHNAPAVIDLVLHGAAFRMVEDAFRDFRPEVAISDAEPWTHRVARHLKIPRIGFDHFGVMAYCRPSMRAIDRVISLRDVKMYRWLMGQPERVIVSSFYDAPARRSGVECIGTLLRDEVFQVQAERGEHLLAYFNKGVHLFSKRIEKALRELDIPVRVYGTRRLGSDGNLEFRPLGDFPFLSDLASCRAVVSTAGNQLVGEALHFGKPMLVMPEDCVEQRVNARSLELFGIGRQISQFRVTADDIRGFLANEENYLANIRRAARDGRREAVETIERFCRELSDSSDSRNLTSIVA